MIDAIDSTPTVERVLVQGCWTSPSRTSPPRRSPGCGRSTNRSPNRSASWSTPPSAPRSTPSPSPRPRQPSTRRRHDCAPASSTDPSASDSARTGTRCRGATPSSACATRRLRHWPSRRTHDGGVYADFHLGAAYEGPPGHVHGGVAALILDHVLGEAASSRRQAAAHRHHHDALPAHHAARRSARPRRDRSHRGRQDLRFGHLADADGVTVEAEGVFIQPRWARD